jgi:tetratricopeptide (TPR) repeat protein
MEKSRKSLWLALLLFVISTAALLHTMPYDFLSVDDNVYVYENQQVLDGISLEGMRNAFRSRTEGYWMPSTMISLAIDSSIWGTRPWGYRLTNLLLHGANAVLVYLFLMVATKSKGASFWVALLFAIHPLRIESVVWISERKDVLSGFWGFLSLWLYVLYGQSRKKRMLVACGASLLIGLMAKPILVTWPFLFLLLDGWPLKRISKWPPKLPILWHLFKEKIPFFLLVILFGVMTWITQQEVGAVRSNTDVPLLSRLAGIAPHYLHYLTQTIRFTRLSFYHSPQQAYSPLEVLGSLAVLIIVTLLCLRYVKSVPALLVGWLWFLGTLFPVIGIVRAGSVAVADRFTYIPHVGLFWAIVWGAQALLAKLAVKAPGIANPLRYCGPGIVCGYLLLQTVQYSKVWENTVTLLDHAYHVDGHSEFVLNNLGVALNVAGQTDRAESVLMEALQDTPHSHVLLNNLGMVYLNKDAPGDAIVALREAFRLQPDSELYRLNLAIAHRAALEFEPARLLLEELMERRPDHARAHYELGRVLFHQEEWSKAETHLRQAIQLDPHYSEAKQVYGVLLNHLERFAEAIPILEGALSGQIPPSPIYFQLAIAHEKLNQSRQAIDYYHRILVKDPDHVSSLNNLAWILATRETYQRQHAEQAVRYAQRAVALAGEPPPVVLLSTLAAAYAAAGEYSLAAQQVETAIEWAVDSGQTNRIESLEQRLDLYRANQPYCSQN